MSLMINRHWFRLWLDVIRWQAIIWTNFDHLEDQKYHMTPLGHNELKTTRIACPISHTVYPKKYAHGFCFAVLCCGYTLTDFSISIRLTSLALWQSNDCPSASKATLINMDKYFMWIHYERLHNHNKAKHNKTVCIFLGIYCSSSLLVFVYSTPLYGASVLHTGPIGILQTANIKGKFGYCQVSNISHTKSHHLKDSRTVLWLSFPNPLKPDVRSRMKM